MRSNFDWDRPVPRRTRSNPFGAPPEPPPPLTGLVVRRKVEAFSPYPLGHVVDGWALYRRWVGKTGGKVTLHEQWVKAPEGYQAILARKRWDRYHSPKALEARRRRSEIDRARRAGVSEWEVQPRFQVASVRAPRKLASSAELPVDPGLVSPAQPRNRFLGKSRPWLWDPEFRPHWVRFCRLRGECRSDEDYAALITLTRPHAEAALARWHALRAEVGPRTLLSRRGGYRRPLPRRRWAPGTLSTPLLSMWPICDTEGRAEETTTHPRAGAGFQGPAIGAGPAGHGGPCPADTGAS